MNVTRLYFRVAGTKQLARYVHKYAAYSSTSFQKKKSHFPSPATLDHPDAGEDAFINLRNENYILNAVFDGVGGWANVGIDPSIFSWGLVREIKKVFNNSDEFQPSPLTLLSKAYAALKKSNTVEAGSSTACLTLFNCGNGKLHSLKYVICSLVHKFLLTLFQALVTQDFLSLEMVLSIMHHLPKYSNLICHINWLYFLGTIVPLKTLGLKWDKQLCTTLKTMTW
nr:azr1+ [Schizosaccharomyces pombe]